MSDLKQTIYLRQSSGFGPWVECEKSHPDAVAFDRRTQPDTVDGDPIGDLQAESRQAKLDDFIASMKTQPEATAPAQDLSAAILARQIIQDTNDTLREQSEGLKQLKAENDQLRAALASSANALIAGDSEVFREFFRASMEWSDIAGREEINLEEDRKAEARYEDALKKAMKANNAILQSQKGDKCE